MAAAVAYNAFLALVPLGIAAVTILSFLGRDGEALEQVQETLELFVPADVTEFFTDLVTSTAEIVQGQQGWIIAVSLLVAIYSGSRGVVALQLALRRIERIEERRPGWLRRIVAIGLTLGAGAMTLVASAALLAGESVAEFFAELIDTPTVQDLWQRLRLPTAVAVVYVFMFAVYRWGPPRPIPRSALAAAVGTAGALVTSLGFGWYLSAVGLGSTYGVLGAVAITLLWLYITTYTILLGAALVAFGRRTGLIEAKPH